LIDAHVSADRRSPTGSVAKWLMMSAVVVAFCVSPLALTAVGVNYDRLGGNPLLKFHPSNWLFAIALASNLLSKTDLPRYISDLPKVFPGAALFILMAAFTVVYAAGVQHAPIMPLIDTFFAATSMLVLYEGVDESTRGRLRWLVHAILFTNACIGIVEFLTQSRLTPFVVAGVPVLHDYRSTALFGHPLENAGTTAGYSLMLFFGGAPSDSPLVKAALIALQLVALVAFGGRTALVLCGLMLAVGSLPTIAGVINGRRFDRNLGSVVVLATPVIIAAAVAAASSGLFNSLIERFEDDKGSAAARFVIFDLFNSFSFEDILLGPDPARLASLQTTLGIEYGIENSWLGLVFQYGAIISAFFVLGLLALLGDFVRRTRPRSVFIVAYFLILVSSSASISVKSFSFNQFAILLLIVFGRVDDTSGLRWGEIPEPRRSANPLLRA
jgi:hypothetical protein